MPYRYYASLLPYEMKQICESNIKLQSSFIIISFTKRITTYILPIRCIMPPCSWFIVSSDPTSPERRLFILLYPLKFYNILPYVFTPRNVILPLAKPKLGVTHKFWYKMRRYRSKLFPLQFSLINKVDIARLSSQLFRQAEKTSGRSTWAFWVEKQAPIKQYWRWKRRLCSTFRSL